MFPALRSLAADNKLIFVIEEHLYALQQKLLDYFERSD
jgi:hypothetical protein